MNNKKASAMMWLLSILVVSMVSIGGFVAYTYMNPSAATAIQQQGSQLPQGATVPGAGTASGTPLAFMNLEGASYSDPFVRTSSDCGITATTTTVTYNMQNLLNTSGTATFDTTSYWYPLTGGAPLSVTDSTAGSVSARCGETYAIKAVRADGAYGDNSQVNKVIAGNAILQPDGVVLYRPTGTVDSLTLGGTVHGTIQATGYDLVLRRALYSTIGSSTTAYRNSTATFRNGDNATRFNPGANGDLNLEFTLRSRETSAVDFSDWGMGYVGLDLTRPSSYSSNYTTTQVIFDGQNLQLADRSKYTPGDSSGLSSDEVVYQMPSKSFNNGAYANALANGQPYTAYSGWTFAGGTLHKLTMLLHTGAGAPDAANNVLINLYPIGNFLGSDGLHVYRAAFDDTTSHAAVFTKMTWTVDI